MARRTSAVMATPSSIFCSHGLTRREYREGLRKSIDPNLHRHITSGSSRCRIFQWLPATNCLRLTAEAQAFSTLNRANLNLPNAQALPSGGLASRMSGRSMDQTSEG
jgi:hypothetical protein